MYKEIKIEPNFYKIWESISEQTRMKMDSRTYALLRNSLRNKTVTLLIALEHTWYD
jgi:hypothetical protein